MVDDVYKPPEAELAPPSEQRLDRFYLVSRAKLSILFMATIGLYALYWFYAHWRHFKDVTGENIWPLPRAIFYVFFTHSLFGKVESYLNEQQIEHRWSPMLLATLFVIISIASNVLDRLSYREIGSPFTDFASLLTLPLALLVLLKAQATINLSLNDRDGTSNNRLTGYNYLWILLGSIFWLFIGIGLLDVLGIIALEA